MPGEFAAPPTSLPNVAPPSGLPPKGVATPKASKPPSAATPTPVPKPGESTTTEAPAEAKKEAERIRLKYKARGQEVERDFTHEDLARKLQLSEGSEAEIARLRKIADKDTSRAADVKKRGLAALREMAGEKWVERSPEEVELDELRAFKKSAAERETQTAAEKAKAAEAAEIESYSQAFVKEVQPIAKALGYSKDYTEMVVVPAIGEVLMRADDAGVQLTTAQAAAEAREILDWRASEHFANMDQPSFVKAVSSRFADAPVELLLEAVGEAGIEKILAHTVAQLRGKQPEPVARPTERPRRQSNDEKIEAATHVVFGQRNR